MWIQASNLRFKPSTAVGNIGMLMSPHLRVPCRLQEIIREECWKLEQSRAILFTVQEPLATSLLESSPPVRSFERAKQVHNRSAYVWAERYCIHKFLNSRVYTSWLAGIISLSGRQCPVLASCVIKPEPEPPSQFDFREPEASSRLGASTCGTSQGHAYEVE